MGAITHDPDGFDPRKIERPDPALLRCYFFTSALALVAFPIVFIPLYIKYQTLRYRIDDEGVSMSWGLLFKREILLTYRRIQDIHVRRNLIERWLGLATVAVQTASGTSGAEMSIVGILRPEKLRDYLYARMRGVREAEAEGRAEQAAAGDEALILLREIRDALRASQEQVS